MGILEAKFVRGFVRMCDDGFRQGWHERNGGNLSYRVKSEEIETVKGFLIDGEWREIGTEVPDLAEEYFLVTGSGKYFRNVALEPEINIGLIRIDGSGRHYQICWGFADGAKPTSELPSHLMNHQAKKQATGGAHRVIYHCHTTSLIALTFILPLEDKIFTRELWEMATECPVVFPAGIGIVKWMVPGGRDIAVASSKLMERYDAIVWAHHGLFCSGEDFDAAFGLAHTIEKSAEILIKVLSASGGKRQTITPEDFRLLAKDFGVTLSEEFLFEKK